MKSIVEGLDKRLIILETLKEGIEGRVKDAIGLMHQCIYNCGKILIMGNGGSAADAQHFAAELVGRFKMERAAMPAIALTTDSSVMTAIGNDYGYDLIFCRQIEALAQPGDVVIGISTSGNSQNVIKAMARAKQCGCLTIGFTGSKKGSINDYSDVLFTVPSTDTPIIQECHITLIHIICELLEIGLFDDTGNEVPSHTKDVCIVKETLCTQEELAGMKKLLDTFYAAQPGGGGTKG